MALLSAVLGDVYDAAVDPDVWPRALEHCCTFIGGASATLCAYDAATKSSVALHIWNDDPHYTQLYFEKYLALNPFFPAATFIAPGLVYTAGDIIPEERLTQTRFYKEWLAPQGIVDLAAVNLEKHAASASVLSIRRDRTHGRVDDVSRSRMALLAPHLQRAISIGRLFDQGRAQPTAPSRILDHEATTYPAALKALAAQFQFTASETRVLDALLRANGVKAVAHRLGVSQATVKSHLHNLFTKTRTAGQTELVKLVAGYKEH